MSLVVDQIKCIEESDEAGTDSVYLVVFQGSTAAPFTTDLNAVGPDFSTVHPKGVWNNFSTGHKQNLDVGIASTDPNAVYAVMLVEKDNGKDIKGDVVNAWRANTDLVWKSVMLGFLTSGQNTGSEAAKAEGFRRIEKALKGLAAIFMEFPKGDDDVLGVKRVTTTVINQPPEKIRFRSNAEDATYDITFVHKDTGMVTIGVV